MDIIRQALLPRRLGQMYTDTKRSYEQIVQANITNPQLSSLHLKLRVQKDRLVAWGLEWADSNTDQTDDIDGSLDRAGISDLVASIMSSIRELLDEAERIQPQSRPQLPGEYPIDKAGILLNTNTHWTPTNLARLDDIIKDITTSIDTLCDLSRSQQILSRGSAGKSEKQTSPFPGSEKTSEGPSSPLSKKASRDKGTVMEHQSDLISSTRIDPTELVYPTKPHLPAVTPPSYNSTATDPGNREFAFCMSSRGSGQVSASSGQSHDTPVLVDYFSEDDANSRYTNLPFLRRYEDLVLALQGNPGGSEHVYTGSLKILGWLGDPHSGRCAFVYEIPQPSLRELQWSPRAVNPTQSLLSYLQNSGDTDSSNVPCLEDRFRLALNLVSNLLHVHAKGLTHRNINSNNIVFVSDNESRGTESKPWKEGVIRKPFIVSWDQCPQDTPALVPETLISNIYRHPGIERGQRSAYRPTHDVYSLGLVLLEIGLWMPLNKLWKTKYSRWDFKARLQAIYTKKLAAKCGGAYMGAVDYCLRAVDEDRSARTSVRLTPLDQQPKVRNDYYWSVLKPLERCCMMDDSDEPRVVPAPSASAARPASLEIHRSPRDFAEAQSPPVIESAVTQEVQVPEPAPSDTMTGYSPAQPGGKIDLMVWRYGVTDETQAYFDHIMMPKLNRLFAKAISKWETYEISVCMTGSSPESAKPTILMVCNSLSKAWKILTHVNEDRKLFDIYVTPGQLTWSKGKKKRGKNSKKAAKDVDRPGQLPSRYQQKPSCGASIGCFVDEQHSEAVTFGGVVLIDGEPHGMSVHHMLGDPDAGVDSGGFEGQAASTVPDQNAIFDDLYNNFDALEFSDYEAEGEEIFDIGDLPGTVPGEGDHVIVTQPALDDVDANFFPSEDDMSDDHLVIHGLGNIHASSGLRRLTYEDIAHEVDWAVFKIHEDRKPTMNAVEGGLKHCKQAAEAFYPSQVIKADALGGLRVHAFGSTSGLETGTILPNMQMTKMPGRLYSSPVWRVKGNFGVGGDSGAWVIDNSTGGVCGHVTAYSESMEYATIAPMEVLLHDMEQTLGTSVALPASKEATSPSFKQQIVESPPKTCDESVTKSPEYLNLRGGSSLDSECGLGGEPEIFSLEGKSPPESPVLATSPPLSSQKLSVLSLNNVAEKWECAQASKRKSLDKSTKDGKVGGAVLVREGVEARC